MGFETTCANSGERFHAVRGLLGHARISRRHSHGALFRLSTGHVWLYTVHTPCCSFMLSRER